LVRLQGTKHGVTLVLDDPGPDAAQLARSLEEVLVRHGSFLRGAVLDIEIGRRPLTREVALAIFDVLARFPEVGVVSLRARGGERRSRMVRREPTLIHYGTVRSGQLVEAEGDLVVVGDVHSGGEVRAGGDIVVTGQLSGVAHAGLGEKGSRATIYAGRLTPEQLRIHRAIAQPSLEEPPNTPELAWLEDGTIVSAPAKKAIAERLLKARRRPPTKTSAQAGLT